MKQTSVNKLLTVLAAGFTALGMSHEPQPLPTR